MVHQRIAGDAFGMEDRFGLETVAIPEGPFEASVIDAEASPDQRADYLISRAPQGGQSRGGDRWALL